MIIVLYVFLAVNSYYNPKNAEKLNPIPNTITRLTNTRSRTFQPQIIFVDFSTPSPWTFQLQVLGHFNPKSLDTSATSPWTFQPHLLLFSDFCVERYWGQKVQDPYIMLFSSEYDVIFVFYISFLNKYYSNAMKIKSSVVSDILVTFSTLKWLATLLIKLSKMATVWLLINSRKISGTGAISWKLYMYTESVSCQSPSLGLW